MENEAIVTQGQTLTAKEVRSQVNLIQEVMKGVMKENEHYGVIPGCGKKKTLLKAGAEKLLSTFKIAANPVVEDLSTQDCARYRVTVQATNMVSGSFLGAGVGECSSDEEKYKWKRVVCNEEFEETSEDMRRIKWFKGYDGKPNYQVKQIRTNPADVANTVLKMAKKRGQIDMTLTVTAASDIFIQDIEEVEDLPNNGATPSKPKTEEPKAKEPEQKVGCISDKQRKRFFAIYKKAGKTDEEVKAYLKENCNIESTKDIKMGDYEFLCTWAETPNTGE